MHREVSLAAEHCLGSPYMVDDDNLSGSEQLLGDDQVADGSNGTAAGVADDMGVAFGKA